MTTRRVSTFPRRLVWSIAGLNLVMMLTRFVPGASSAAGYSTSNTLDALAEVLSMVNVCAYTVLAVLIVSRQPHHTIGWLFLTAGFFAALRVPSFGPLGELTVTSEPWRGLLAWLGHLAHGVWIPAYFIPISFVLQYFPDGRLPARRWWPIPVATLIGLCGIAASIALHPGPWPLLGFDAPNPFGIAGSAGFFESLFSLSQVFVVIGLLGSFGAVVVRFFRSSGVERAQMKWLVYAAAITLLPLVLAPGGSVLVGALFLSAPTVLAAAIGIAILRHRLWDIDVIIRRTLVYSTLTALLALAYFGSVLVLQGLFGALAGAAQSPLVTVLSTLAIAALFVPVRRRVQTAIDRRFYRRKVDAARTLADFAATARDETDLDRLAARLVQVVQETMQPEPVALWLKQSEKWGNDSELSIRNAFRNESRTSIE